MVKLVFNPKNIDKNQVVPESKSSKKKEINLNPFNDHAGIDIEIKESSGLQLKDLVGLENCNYVLNDWYTKSLRNEINKMLLIIGPVGCGKTSLIELYCRENSIQLYIVRTSDTIKTKKDLLKDIVSFSSYKLNFFVKNDSVKKLILIDEYQNSQSDLLCITDINNLFLLRTKESISENKKELSSFLSGISEINFVIPPIVIISADSKGSKLSDIKKIHEVYYINEIPQSFIKTWIKKLYPGFSEPVLTKLIKKCKSDKRLLLNTIEFIKQNKEEEPGLFIESFHKDMDINIFEFMNELFDNTEIINLDDIFKVYDTDGFLLSNLVFENYIDYSSDIHTVANASEAISMGEILFSDTFESSKSFIPEVHCLNALCIPSYYCRSEVPNKNLRSCCINNRYNIYLNNKKILSKLNVSHPETVTIYDCFMIKKILNQTLIKTKVLNVHQEDFLKNIIGSLKSLEKLELIYKHFSDFSGKETKTKNFTLKFKEKIKNLK